MSNAEYYEKIEELACAAAIMIRNCKGDRTQINEGMWNALVEIETEIDDYIFEGTV